MWNSNDTLTEQDFDSAYRNLKDIVKHTPLEFNTRLSEKFNAEVYLKREDMQWVRSYKLRGAYHMISSLSQDELSRGVVLRKCEATTPRSSLCLSEKGR